MKKLLLQLLLTTSIFASTIPLSPYEKCDLAMDKAGKVLLEIHNDELNNDISKLHYDYNVFMSDSNKAISSCKDISIQIINDLIDIQNAVTKYYNTNYR